MHETPPPQGKKGDINEKKLEESALKFCYSQKERWCVELTRRLLQMDQWGHGNLLGEYGTEMTLEGASN